MLIENNTLNCDASKLQTRWTKKKVLLLLLLANKEILRTMHTRIRTILLLHSLNCKCCCCKIKYACAHTHNAHLIFLTSTSSNIIEIICRMEAKMESMQLALYQRVVAVIYVGKSNIDTPSTNYPEKKDAFSNRFHLFRLCSMWYAEDL